MTASPNMTLTMQHVPQHCRRARTILLGPLTPQDLDAATFITFKQGAPQSSIDAPSLPRYDMLAHLHTGCHASTLSLSGHWH